MLSLKTWLIGTAAVGCCWAASSAFAGTPTPRQPSPFRFVQYKSGQPKPRSYTDKGIVSAVTANSISIVADNKTWVLRPRPGCVVEVTGQAEPSFLKSGMIVRLYGEFDKRYKAVAPVTRLEIVSPTMPNLTAGVFPDTLPPVDEKAKGNKADEEKPKDETGEAADKDAKTSAESGTPMMVVGILKLVKDNELLISADKRTIRAPLAEQAEIRVSLSDFTLAKRGDAATKFSCDYFQPGAGFAKLLQIELTNPLEGPKKPVRKPAVRPAAKAKGKAK